MWFKTLKCSKDLNFYVINEIHNSLLDLVFDQDRSFSTAVALESSLAFRRVMAEMDLVHTQASARWTTKNWKETIKGLHED